MIRNLFVLPDKTEIFSGVGASPAIQALTYTAAVNCGTDLDYGSACAAVVEATLIDTSGAFSLAAGDEMAVYDVDDAGARTLLGLFIPETPRKPSANTYKITAYDRMIKFDKDLSNWLAELPDWPYTMSNFLALVCSQCGVETVSGLQLLNGDFPILRFVQQVTGRQLIKWIAGANGAFAHITPEGKLNFSAYADGGSLELPMRSLKVSDYTTAPIERVAIKQTEDDVGVSWPVNSTGETYTILGNPLMATFDQGEMLSYVERLAARLIGLSYTPVEAQVFTDTGKITPGSFYKVKDRNGHEYKTVVFSAKRSGGTTTIISTGNASRAGSTAIAEKDQIKILQGRVAEVKFDLDEVSFKLKETEATANGVSEKNAALVVRVDSLTSRVSETEKAANGTVEWFTQIDQKTNSLEILIGEKADQGAVEELTEHFIFDDDGLTITNRGTGMGIGISEQRVIFTGGSSATTVIRPDEMETTNLRIGSRLDLGKFSFLPRTNGNLSFRYTGGD